MHDAVLNPTLCIPLHRGAERFERMVYIELAFNAASTTCVETFSYTWVIRVLASIDDIRSAR
jgi:hypothetical protein